MAKKDQKRKGAGSLADRLYAFHAVKTASARKGKKQINRRASATRTS